MPVQNSNDSLGETLDQKNCIPCRGGIPPLDKESAENLLKGVSDWKLIEGALKVQRNYAFDNFVDALEFTNKVGALSETENHHPDITLGWGYCSIIFYSHKINGLHENDFIMAAKVSELYKSF